MFLMQNKRDIERWRERERNRQIHRLQNTRDYERGDERDREGEDRMEYPSEVPPLQLGVTRPQSGSIAMMQGETYIGLIRRGDWPVSHLHESMRLMARSPRAAGCGGLYSSRVLLVRRC